MIPCRHKIVRMTNAALGILCALLVRVEAKGKESRQMVYTT